MKEKEPGIRLEIWADHLVPKGHDVRITLNGLDITTALQSLELRMGVGELNTVKLTLLTKEISVDAAARLLLETRLNAMTMVAEEMDGRA